MLAPILWAAAIGIGLIGIIIAAIRKEP